MTGKPPKNFYEIQREQWRVSLALFAVLLLFYAFAMSMVLWLGVFGVAIFTHNSTLLMSSFSAKVFMAAAALAVLMAALHFHDARRNGARFIIERLEAAMPDKEDGYHRRMVNLVDEMRIASGLPRVAVYVIPTFAINSMALLEEDGRPAVIVTEGMMADLYRDEQQAVVAHELAHITRGDTFYLTMVCSLVNVFERLRAWLEALMEDRPHGAHSAGGRGDPVVFAGPMFVGVLLSSGVMRLLSILISRRRETLADAAAVEMTRNPLALARAIFKAELKYSFVGDFNAAYSPLFIVDPNSKGGPGANWLGKLFSTHPPMEKRVAALAAMAHVPPEEVGESVWRSWERREQSRTVVLAADETLGRSGPRGASAGWMIEDGPELWRGPMPLEDLLLVPWFSPLVRVRPAEAAESEAAPARQFRDIRRALGFLADGPIPKGGDAKGRCPRCRTALARAEYEGAPIMQCGECGGKAAPARIVARILTRREVKFSERLMEKADAFRRAHLVHPEKLGLRDATRLTCPECGAVTIARPFSYQYFIAVDRCMACQTIWFDADELEMLQILVEENQRERANIAPSH